MPRGGARPNSGPQKGAKYKPTLEKAAARELWRKRVTEHLEPLIAAHIRNAIGLDHFFLKNSKTQQFERITNPKVIEVALNSGDEGTYYWIQSKDPSTQSLQYLVDQALDKAPQSVAVTGPEGGPLKIVIEKPW